MLCRVLLAAIGITYLVCVLFLSGIQKEDLEVSLLKKMQHYNIDFDKNNQVLRKECLNNSNSTNDKAENDNTTTEKVALTTIHTPTILAATLDTSELQSVLKYLKHKKKIRNPPTTESMKKTSENTERIKRLFEKLMSENDENVKKPHNLTENKQSASEDIQKYLLPYTEKLDALIANNTENITSVAQTSRNEDNATKETVKKDMNLNIFEHIEEIGKAISEYLGRKNTLSPKISLEKIKRTTEQPRVSAQDIEQKFALGIAAINKLNENIALLQKNFNGAIFLNSKVSNQSKEKIELQVAETKNKSKQIVVNAQETVENFTDGNGQILPKITGIDKYIFSDSKGKIISNPTAIEKVDVKIQAQSDHLKNINSLDTLATTYYDYLRFTESPIMGKNNLIHTPDSKDVVAPSNSYENRKLPNPFTEQIHSSKNNFEMDQHSQKIKEITNYNYEKETVPESPNGEQSIKLDTDNPFVYVPRPQILPNVINYGYYNTNQPTNPIHNFQYNRDGLGNDLTQSENRDIPPYNSDTKIVPDELHVPVLEDNVDIYKNSQMHYPDATQIVQEAIQRGFDKQIDPNTQVIDIQSIINSLNNKKLPVSQQIQNGKDTQFSRYDSQKGPDSYILNHEESPLNTDIILNKGNDNREPKKDSTNPFSTEMISKIAETVKEIVLKDLKKQIISNTFNAASLLTTLSTIVASATAAPLTTTSITTTTTPATITTTPVTTTTTPATTTTTPATTTTTPATTTTTSATITTTPVTTTTSTSTTTAATPKTTSPASKPKLTIPVSLPYTAPSAMSFTDTDNGDLTNKSRKIEDNKVQVATQAIEKFIQLFEQMKSAQEISFKSNEKRTKLPGNMVPKPRYDVPIVMYPPPINPYGMRVPKQMPIIVHNYIPPTLTHPPFPPSFAGTLDTKNSMSPIHRSPAFGQPRFPHAIMIQTNTHEIQPLGIPVMKPEAMNMNIIVTTQNPFWTREASDRWNYMYKYGRNPDKKNDFKLTNNLNVYSNDQVNNNPPVKINTNQNKPLNKNSAVDLNNTNLVDDNMRMNIFKQFESYINKQLNVDKNKNANEEVRNRVPLDASRYNNLETNRYQSNIHINDSNIQAFINQMAKNNEQSLFGMPSNKEGLNSINNAYKISNINPNVMYGQLQNGDFTNQMYSYKIPENNVLNLNINHGLKTPGSIQYDILNQNINPVLKTPGSIQYGHYRDKNPANHNEINNYNVASESLDKFHFIPITKEQMKNLRETNKNRYSKPSSDSQTYNVEAMPTKDINYSNQVQLYRSAQNNHFNTMPSYRVKYSDNSRPTFNNRMQNKPKYHLENNLSTDEMKTTYKNLEKYYDNPSRMEAVKMREKALLKQERDYTRPMYQNSDLNNDYSSALDKIKTKYENPGKYYSSPSDENSNREFNRDKQVRPHKRITSESNSDKLEGKNQALQQPQMDLVSAVFGQQNRQKGNHERVHTFDSSDTNSQDHRSRVITSDDDMRGRTLQTESSDSDKYASNVRGFHEKLESSDGWPEQSDCGPDEHCISSVKILSRQQMPLDSKKPTKYDDSRFKTFLKTQEKVNRMLEMILATKGDNVAQSVDTL